MMKKLLFLIGLLLSTIVNAQNFNVPDANFEQALIDLGIDTTSPTDQIDGQTNLSIAVTGTKTLKLWNKAISDLTGIENFTSLEWLEVDFNNLTEVDLSNNTNLVRVVINHNNLISLDVSNLSNLDRLYCQSNKLTSLVLPTFSKLDRLECAQNNLTELDLSKSNLLTTLNCGGNEITTISLDNCTILQDFDAAVCNIESIQLDKNIALEDVNLGANNLEHIDLSNSINLKTLRLKSSEYLKTVNLKNINVNSITSFDVSFSPYLTCIEVDDVSFAMSKWPGINAHISFNTDCPPEPIIVSIPDTNFEQHLIDENIDIDGIINGEILKAYAEDITYLNLPNKNISSLSGIEEFTSLETLRAHENNLTNIDLSNNLELTTLILALNQLTSIDLSNNAKLEQVILQTNNLTSLNIKNGTNTLLDTAADFIIDDNPNLICVAVDDINYSNATWSTKDAQTQYSLACSSIITVSIPDSNFEQALIDQNIDSDGVINGLVLASDIETIEYLDVNSKNISDITGIEGFKNLETLFAYNNSLTAIDVSENFELTGLVVALNQLTSIDVSKNTKLISLSLNNNSISNLDVSLNTGLKQIYIDNNELTSLNVSNLLDLEELSFINNNVVEIQVNTNAKLRILDCSVNQISVINLLSNPALESLSCERNTIEYLDLSQNPLLVEVICNDNVLKGLNIKNGANTNIINENFIAFANYDLSCIKVDDVNYSNSNWAQIEMSTTYSLNCTPANDDCSFTFPIILGQDTPGDTTSALGSVNNPNCLPSGIVAFDVWYSFPAPASGSITMTINAPPFIGKVALYNSCADAQPIYCGENELIVNGLTPGATYYLQVWLEQLSISGKGVASSKSFNQNGQFVLNVQDSSILSIENSLKDEFDGSIYPNPAENFITIKSRNPINSIQVFNISGQRLINRNANSNTTNIVDVSNLKSGLYLLKIKDENATYTKKIIIK